MCSQNDVPAGRELAAEKIPVAVTCRVLGFSKQAYYAWCKQPVSQRDWDDAHLINAALDIHADDPAFGYRFIADDEGQGPCLSVTVSRRVMPLVHEAAQQRQLAVTPTGSRRSRR